MVMKTYGKYGVCLLMFLAMTIIALVHCDDAAQTVRFCLAATFLCACSLEDVHERLIDDRIVAAGALVFAGYLLVAYDGAALRSAFKELLITCILLAVLYILSRKGIGFGDIKVLGVLSLLFGWVATMVIFAAALLAGIATCVGKRAFRRADASAEIAFIPYILASATVFTAVV